MTGRPTKWLLSPFRVRPDNDDVNAAEHQRYLVRAAIYPDNSAGVAVYLNQRLQAVLPEEEAEALIGYLQASLDRARKLSND
jgi:hypothetical protein